MVPGCRNPIFVDVHHIVLRSEGGDDDPDHMVVLCGAHHRAQHRGQLIIDGRVSTGLEFRHADGSLYGGAVSPRPVSVYEDAFRGLRSLGFREGEVRVALNHIRTHNSLTNPTIQQVLRAALTLLTPGARSVGRTDAGAPQAFA